MDLGIGVRRGIGGVGGLGMVVGWVCRMGSGGGGKGCLRKGGGVVVGGEDRGGERREHAFRWIWFSWCFLLLLGVVWRYGGYHGY